MPPINRSALKIQWLRYSQDPSSFVRNCIYIYDATGQDWIKFDLWPAQAETLGVLVDAVRDGACAIRGCTTIGRTR